MNLQSCPRRLILVTGMHRSGTSALTRMLNLLGADLGGGLLPAREDNPRGYWEASDIIALNDECLEHFGTTWFDPLPLPEGWEDSPWTAAWQARLVALLRARHPTSSHVAVKDPRIARLLPAWLNAAREAGFEPGVILALRDPDEVVASLGKRRDARLTPSRIRLLWLAHLLEGEHGSRGLPRAIVRHGDLLTDWRRVAASLEAGLQLQWPRRLADASPEIDAFIDPGLHRQQAGRLVAEREGRLSTRCRELYVLLDEALPDLPLKALDHARERLVDDVELASTAAGTDPVATGSGVISPATEWMPSETMTLLARAYFPDASGCYDETRSQEVTLAPEPGPRAAHFDIPSDTSTARLRFDPAEAPGSYRILSFVVNGRPVAATGATILALGGVRLPDDGDGALRIHADDTDPWIELCFADTLGAGQTLRSLEVRFERDSPFDRLDRQLQAAAARQDTLADAIARIEASQASMLQSQQDLLQRTESNLTQLGALSTSVTKTRDLALATLVTSHSANARRADRIWGGRALSMQPSNLRPVARNGDAGLQAWEVAAQPARVLLRPHRTLTPGWYVLGIALQSTHGEMAPVPLKLDHGDGFDSGSTRVLALTPGSLRQRLLLRLDRPVHALALEPSVVPGSAFLLGSSPRLRRVTKPEAMLRLGVPAIRRFRALGASWASVAREVRTALGRGSSTALDVLHANATVNAPGGSGAANDYARWIELHDTLDDAARNAMDADIGAMQAPPLISIVMPAYNTPERWLRRCIESVRAQRYPHWELCIANDASTEPQVREVLDEYAAAEPRIRVIHRARNGHISAASNSALTLATGDWVALLDHDDELPEHALYHVAKTILAHPDAMLIYSDEDKITESGERYDPYFKPDWNPELFLSQNMISHLGVYRTSLLRELGGFREGLEGSQDYDLALRVIERIAPSQIIHIPRVLYHWRAIDGSTAVAGSEKGYAAEAALRAVNEHFQRIGSASVAEPGAFGYHRIHHPLPDPPPSVSVIIPTRNGLDLLRTCVRSILEKTDYPDLEILIVDNQSDEPEMLAWLKHIVRHDGRVRVLEFDEPFNFSRINNFAVARATGELVGLVNNDIEARSACWLSEMASHAVRPGNGIVGAKLYYPDGRIQHAGVVLGYLGVAGHAGCGKPAGYTGHMARAVLAQNMSAVTAACLLMRKSIYQEVGGMNEDLGVAFNDVDLCLRVREAGYRNVWTPHAELIHHESASRGYEDTPEKQARFADEVARMHAIWGDALRRDPAYNPNLALSGEPFSFNFEPTHMH